jgi:hypothetical protein
MTYFISGIEEIKMPKAKKSKVEPVKPTASKLEFYDWFEVERYLVEKGYSAEALDEIRIGFECGNDSYASLDLSDIEEDDDDYEIKKAMREEFGEDITFWVSW